MCWKEAWEKGEVHTGGKQSFQFLSDARLCFRSSAFNFCDKRVFQSSQGAYVKARLVDSIYVKPRQVKAKQAKSCPLE